MSERLQWWVLKGGQLALFVGFLAAQQAAPPGRAAPRDLPPPVDAGDIRLFSLGEPAVAARVLGFWLLGFDSRAGQAVPFGSLDYVRLVGWLETIQALDPLSDMPVMSAAGVFVDVKDPARARRMIEFVHRAFLEAPALRWRWMAQVVLLAKYRLGDLELARRLAADLRARAGQAAVPAWARDMEVLILQDMGEFEAARRLIETMLARGDITDPAELRFLTARLEQVRRQLESE